MIFEDEKNRLYFSYNELPLIRKWLSAIPSVSLSENEIYLLRAVITEMVRAEAWANRNKKKE